MFLGVQIGLVCAVAVGLAMLVVWAFARRRTTPEKREYSRRRELQNTGRLGDALLSEVQDDTLYYTYKVRGVQYAASQDVSSLRDLLPEDPARLVGMVGMKYSLANPANSMLICEEWSGLRQPLRAVAACAGVSGTGAALANSTALANSNGVGHQAQDSALAQSS
jgi:hypothetical protein